MPHGKDGRDRVRTGDIESNGEKLLRKNNGVRTGLEEP